MQVRASHAEILAGHEPVQVVDGKRELMCRPRAFHGENYAPTDMVIQRIGELGKGAADDGVDSDHDVTRFETLIGGRARYRFLHG